MIDMFARTERLLLRPGWPEDAPALARTLGDEGIVRNLSRVPWPYGVEQAEEYLARPHDPESVSLLVFRRTRRAPQLIGSAGLRLKPGRAAELGYWISRPHWGLGYATEAADAVITLARDALRLKRIDAAHFLDNPASGRVLRKLGFRPTAIGSLPSAARGTSVPARLFTLDLDAEAEAEAACSEGVQMIAA
jgi:RimJ/RimL family protein N-acetyltransferase